MNERDVLFLFSYTSLVLETAK